MFDAESRGGGEILLRRRTALHDAGLLDGFSRYFTAELGRAQRTAESYCYALRSLARWTGKPLAEITANDLRRFKRESGYQPSTKQQVVVAMKQLHKYGALEELWPMNGIMAVPSPKVIPGSKSPLSAESARGLLAAAQGPIEKRVVYFGLYAGTRIHEAALMDESHLTGGVLSFVGKGAKRRKVPLHPELEPEMEEIFSHLPASTGVAHAAFARVRERCPVLDEEGNPATSHTLRRTFASAMYDAGVPYEVVAKLLGHGSDVTAQYARVRLDTMIDAVRQVDYSRGIPVQMALF